MRELSYNPYRITLNLSFKNIIILCNLFIFYLFLQVIGANNSLRVSFLFPAVFAFDFVVKVLLLEVWALAVLTSQSIKLALFAGRQDTQVCSALSRVYGSYLEEKALYPMGVQVS